MTQRLIGQQSMAEFLGLHLNLKGIYMANQQKKGYRKNGILINTEDNLTS